MKFRVRCEREQVLMMGERFLVRRKPRGAKTFLYLALGITHNQQKHIRYVLHGRQITHHVERGGGRNYIQQ